MVIFILRKYIILFIALAFISAVFNFQAIPLNTVNAEILPGSYDLKLMTFNVRTMNADNDTPNAWNRRKDIAVNAIDSFGPDIIGMQEATIEQIDYFRANCSLTYVSVGTSREGSVNSSGFSNVMYRSDKFNLLNWGEFWLSETPDVPGSKSSLDTAYPRMSTWVKLQAKDNPNAIFYYFNTHFSLIDKAQEQGANLILTKVGEYVTAPDTPVFIGGDLNCDETEPPYAILQKSTFEDTWSEAGKSFDNDSTFHDWTGEKDNGHLDWIFERNITAINSIDINDYNEDGYYPSDHYPVNLDVTIPLTTDTSARPIGSTIWLKASANGKYVSARANVTDSPLWASATAAYTWEEYDVVDAGNGLVALRSKANNLFVTARVSYADAPLQARAATMGFWEKFIWVSNSGGTISLRSIANNKYVSARANETNFPLETRSDSIATWERFTWGY